MTTHGPPATDLVTGAAGFVGRHLLRHLDRRGRRARALDLSLDGVDLPAGHQAIVGDLGDPEVLQRAFAETGDGEMIDTVYHLAAAHLAVRAPASEYRRVNVEATAALAEAAADAGARRFVHVSSVGVYGELTSPPADEDTPCRPEHAYERTKLDGEAAVLDVHRRRGLHVVVLRPAWIYGPGCGRTEKLFRAIASRRFLVAGDGSALRHGLFIDDFLGALDRAATVDAAVGRVIVVADAGAVPVAEWLAIIARLVDAPRPRSIPRPLFQLAAAGVEGACRLVGREPPVSRRTLRFFTANTAFTIDRARRLLDFEPRFDPADGLRETARRLGWIEGEP